ncbi:MAG: DUF6036 family nucleotidyltransferase [Candidatus Thorarchaeota archaeon]
MKRIDKVLQIVCTFLNQSKIDYVVVGGIAVMYHGVPRTTVDIDFIVQLDESEITTFTAFLQSHNFDVTENNLTDALAENSHCTVFVDESLLRLDIQGVISKFDRMTLQRAIIVNHLGTSIRLGTVEDTIVNKILFDGEQDLRDALGIYRRNSENLDYSYIEQTCSSLGIEDNWTAFLEKVTQK